MMNTLIIYDSTFGIQNSLRVQWPTDWETTEWSYSLEYPRLVR